MKILIGASHGTGALCVTSALTNGSAKGKYVRATGAMKAPATISRADVADFMVEACASTAWVGKRVQLGG